MLCSDGNKIEKILNDIIGLARDNEEMEKKVYSILETHLRYLQDVLFESTIEPLPEEQPSTQSSNERKMNIKKQGNEKIEASEFDEALTKKFGRHYSLSELISIATAIGPKYGIFLTREEKRSRPKTILWLKNHFDLLKDDFINAASNIESKTQKKKKQ